MMMIMINLQYKFTFVYRQYNFSMCTVNWWLELNMNISKLYARCWRCLLNTIIDGAKINLIYWTKNNKDQSFEHIFFYSFKLN